MISGLLQMSDDELKLRCVMMSDAVDLYGIGAKMSLKDGTEDNILIVIEDNPSSQLLNYVGYNHRDDEADPVLGYASIIDGGDIDPERYIGAILDVFVGGEYKKFRVDKVKITLMIRAHVSLVMIPYEETRPNREQSDNIYGAGDKKEDMSNKEVNTKYTRRF